MFLLTGQQFCVPDFVFEGNAELVQPDAHRSRRLRLRLSLRIGSRKFQKKFQTWNLASY